MESLLHSVPNLELLSHKDRRRGDTRALPRPNLTVNWHRTLQLAQGFTEICASTHVSVRWDV